MKYYILNKVKSNEDGSVTISWMKDLFLFKNDAFARADEIGEECVVSEVWCHQTWNQAQRQIERDSEGW